MTAPLPPHPSSPESPAVRGAAADGPPDRHPPRQPRRGGRWWRWTVREAAEAAAAQVALCAAQLQVWTRPRGRLLAVGGGSSPAPLPLGAAERQALIRAAQAVDRAARRGLFRPSCLVRALAARRVLGWVGLGDRAALRIGVRMRDGGAGTALEAHAWVECGGVVLDETPRQWAEFEALSDADPVR